MATKASTHYVARLVVEAVTIEEVEQGRYDSGPKPGPKRTKHTVASITLASGDVTTLTERVKAHMDLIEDGGDVDG